jgi:cation:H+ antiporter
MEWVMDSWSLVVILVASFVIGWGAETAQTFLPRALALTILAWLQTLPEFAVEATIAWNQQRDLMIANLTGSLRLLVGLGWPMIFFVHFFFQGIKNQVFIKEIKLEKEDSFGVLFLFASIAYFFVILAKHSLTCMDAGILIFIYILYLFFISRQPVHAEEDPEDLPWIGKKIVKLSYLPKLLSVTALFVGGGVALYVSVHPFIETLQKWALAAGISTFVFVQWVAPFLSEFPEKVTAFNWARQKSKAGMGVMNMVNSNINQWTMLAAMIPIVFNLSLGRLEPVTLDSIHWTELALTVAQSFLGGLLLLDLRFSIWDALVIFILWLVQFLYASVREEILIVYLAWIIFEIGCIFYRYLRHRHIPSVFLAFQPGASA